MNYHLHIVTGTTAVGKTAWTLDYAERIGAEILSCDASCFYRGMDIGTAKPTKAEQKRVPHHLIDVAPVDEAYDIGRFVEAATAVCETLLKKGKPVVVAGGSGFYLKSFFAAVADTTEVPAPIRQEVRALEEAKGLDGLTKALLEANPDGVSGIDLQNPRRVSRALERCLASGKSLAQLQQEFNAQKSPFDGLTKRLVLLNRDPADLNRRIEQRVQQMLATGLIEEVRTLDKLGLRKNPAAASAIGYREILAHLDGSLTAAELPEAIALNTRRLAAKQRKWFRTQLPKPDEVLFFAKH